MMNVRACGWLLAAALLASGPVAAQNLLTNGSFEQPAYPSGVTTTGTMTGWTSSSGQFEVWNGFQGPGADGGQYLELDVSGCTTVSQTIPTTTLDDYTVSLAFAPRNGYSDNSIEVRWNGAVIGTASADGSANAGNVVWTYHSYPATGATGTSTLEITNTDACNHVGALLDDVVVTAVPKPAPVPVPGLGLGALLVACCGLMVLALAERRSPGGAALRR